MQSLILHPTATAQWQALVHEAKKETSIQLSEDLESYLVFLLMRFAQHPEAPHAILATEFLNGLEQIKQFKQETLRNVGDKCLLFTGLFPGTARRRRVRLSYYIKLGQTAYLSLASSDFNDLSSLFAALGDRFVGLMDILQTMRELTHQIDLLQAEELWTDVKSLHALKVLQKNTRGFIINDSKNSFH